MQLKIQKKRREPEMKTAEGPYKVIFIIAGKEATRDEVIAHINRCYAEKYAEKRKVMKGV